MDGRHIAKGQVMVPEKRLGLASSQDKKLFLYGHMTKAKQPNTKLIKQ